MITSPMKISFAILGLGLLALIAYPFLGPQAFEATSINGFWPKLLVPAGYFVSAIGAAGLAVAWMKHRSV